MVVSIPQWFDYNINQKATGKVTIEGVSIPQWFDYNALRIALPATTSHVSIPQWFDYNRFVNKVLPQLNDVSIPQWFDYNIVNILYSTLEEIGLNSTMVRLQPKNFI